MFNKVAKFKMLPPRRPARSVTAPANDNRRNAEPCASDRARAQQLVCRWSLSPDTGRPICRWELDTTDVPSPRRAVALCAARRFERMTRDTGRNGLT
jgi:hypothetical protein